MHNFEYIALLAVFLAVLLIFRSVRMVPQGYEYTVERFGKYIQTIPPGLHLLVPVIDRIGAKINMMENVMDVPSQDVITKDNAAVIVDGIVFFQVLDAARSVYEVSNLKQSILKLTMTNIRTVMGSMDMDELLSHREVINARLLTVIDDATSPWGTKVTRVEIKDIKPPRDIVDSMARQMKAERDKRATVLDAEAERQSEILKAEGVKQGMILEAEGRLESAQRDASARERLAEAEANATKSVSVAIQEGSVQAVNYFVAQKYIEALKSIASSPNQKLLMLPMEATAILGSLSGIAEVAKEAFSNESSSKKR